MTSRPHFTPEAQATFGTLEALARAAAEKRRKGTARATGKKWTKSSRQEGLFKQVAKTIQQLAADPRHNSLNTHAYESLENPFDSRGKIFEAYAQNSTPGAYRVFWCYGPEKGDLTIIAITPHP
ncbi:MAG: hypothetical protein JF887_01975 [Candidatus Dormibacteraeota bacterium]|uniref:Uncharacterized protein n=1 Tax=Candidatus Amunia macphersoniae TaxID=3127014 RepID=A0A934NIL5_9BACT|nr:hypothetical protein [Candidatus Dormibacteraeota bacterium]